AVGDGRGVVYTSDGGATWSIIAAPGATGVLNSVAARSAASALAVGDGGQIKALSGTSVTSRATIGNTLYSVTFADDNHVWVVGSDAGVFKSTDGGATFTTATRTLPGGFTANQLTMRSIAFANPYDGIIVSTLQMVWRTSDAGASWAPERLVDPSTLDDYELRAVAFAGSASVPVTVGRYNGGFFPSSGREKARAYRGSWTGIPAQPSFPPGGVSVVNGTPRPRSNITWSDNSADEDGFVIERSVGSASGPWTTLDTLSANATSYTDGTIGWTSTYYYRVQSFRGESYSAWAVSGPFAADAVAPTTTSDAHGAYVESATVMFTANDNAGGSGLAHTWSTVDGSGLLDAPVRTVTGFGSHTLAFWSEDVAGNTETHRSVVLYISDPSIPDTTAPVTTSDAVKYYANSATITLAASDDVAHGGSGVAATYYILDGGAQVQASMVTVGAAGAHALAFWSVDAAGIVEDAKTVTFTIVASPSSGGAPSTPLCPSLASTSKSFTLSGYVVRLPAGTSSVTLRFYRYVSGTYRYYKTVSAKVSDFLTFSKYSGSTSVPYSGKWRVRAARKIGSTYVYSAYSYLTVIATPSSKGTPSTPSAPATVSHGVAFTTFGYVVRHTSGTSPVTLRFYRYVSGSYRYSKTVSAKVSDFLTFSKYSDSTSVPYSGKWRVRAAHKVGSVNKYSGYRYFTSK
ncbi:MAG TPA: YCF48-related protein, partial [Propionibacteriaceae bacterium]